MNENETLNDFTNYPSQKTIDEVQKDGQVCVIMNRRGYITLYGGDIELMRQAGVNPDKYDMDLGGRLFALYKVKTAAESLFKLFSTTDKGMGTLVQRRFKERFLEKVQMPLGILISERKVEPKTDKMQSLIDKFNEVREKVPYDRLGENGRDGQTLFGDVMDWCRDYFNEPKDPMLAYMLVGYYFTNKQITKRK